MSEDSCMVQNCQNEPVKIVELSGNIYVGRYQHANIQGGLCAAHADLFEFRRDHFGISDVRDPERSDNVRR